MWNSLLSPRNQVKSRDVTVKSSGSTCRRTWHATIVNATLSSTQKASSSRNLKIYLRFDNLTGTFATMSPHWLRPHCQSLMCGGSWIASCDPARSRPLGVATKTPW